MSLPDNATILACLIGAFNQHEHYARWYVKEVAGQIIVIYTFILLFLFLPE